MGQVADTEGQDSRLKGQLEGWHPAIPRALTVCKCSLEITCAPAHRCDLVVRPVRAQCEGDSLNEPEPARDAGYFGVGRAYGSLHATSE